MTRETAPADPSLLALLKPRGASIVTDCLLSTINTLIFSAAVRPGATARAASKSMSACTVLNIDMEAVAGFDAAAVPTRSAEARRRAVPGSAKEQQLLLVRPSFPDGRFREEGPVVIGLGVSGSAVTERKCYRSSLRRSAHACSWPLIPLALAEDAAAVLLAIEVHAPRLPNAVAPSRTKVLIEEFDAVLAGHFRGNAADHVMLLIFAVEQGGGKCREPQSARLGSSNSKPHTVALLAAAGAPAEHPRQVPFQVILVPDSKLHRFTKSIVLHRVQPLPILPKRMDIGVVEKTGNVMAVRPQPGDRIDRAGGTAYMEEYLQGSPLRFKFTL